MKAVVLDAGTGQRRIVNQEWVDRWRSVGSNPRGLREADIIAERLTPEEATDLVITAEDPMAVTFTVEEVTMALVRSLEREIVTRSLLNSALAAVERLDKHGNGLGIACNYLVDRILERPCECWEGSTDLCWRCTLLAHTDAVLREWE